MTALLAAILLAQEKSGEETLKKLEELILNAKTVTVKYHYDVEARRSDTAVRCQGPGLVLLKHEDKSLHYTKRPFLEFDTESLSISDGTDHGWKLDDAWDKRPTPVAKGTGRKDRLSLVRGGAMGLVAPVYLDDLEAKSKAIGITASTENEMLLISYKIQLEHGKVSDIKLWCDPKTLLPKKRIYSFFSEVSDEKSRVTKTEGTATETYEQFVLDAEIPDEKFKLPLELVNEKGAQKVRADLLTMRTALALYQRDNDMYPTTEQGLEALLRKPKQGLAKNWKGPYFDLTTIPKDPWGFPYVYLSPGVRNPADFDLYSVGPDGKPGTDDDVEK